MDDSPPATEQPKRWWWIGVCVALAIPALVQIALVGIAWAGRFFYPFDLEWMEGGMLAHAQQIRDGSQVYAEPSVHFIAYPYTPLYSIVVASLGSVFGVSYQVARFVSIVATGISGAMIMFAVQREAETTLKLEKWVVSVVALGLFAAAYPWMDGWYDLARVDSLFLAMVLCGVVGVRHWAHHPSDMVWRYAGLGGLLGMSFFCKQTGVLFVGCAGVFLLFLDWRRLVPFVIGAAVVGLGITWAANTVSEGWFWTYIYEVHQAHDFNMDRFYKAISDQLFHFPLAFFLIATATALSIASLVAKKKLSRTTKRFFLWLFAYAVSVLAGAMGWAIQWAHINAYIPFDCVRFDRGWCVDSGHHFDDARFF